MISDFLIGHSMKHLACLEKMLGFDVSSSLMRSNMPPNFEIVYLSFSPCKSAAESQVSMFKNAFCREFINIRSDWKSWPLCCCKNVTEKCRGIIFNRHLIKKYLNIARYRKVLKEKERSTRVNTT